MRKLDYLYISLLIVGNVIFIASIIRNIPHTDIILDIIMLVWMNMVVYNLIKYGTMFAPLDRNLK
jgi:hypothetical protein